MKSDFRKNLKGDAPTSEESQNASRALGHALKHFFPERKLLRGGAYRALPSEIHLDASQLENVGWAYPKVVEQKMSYFVPGPGGFTLSDHKVLEPVTAGAHAVELKDLDFVLIPGMAFSVEGDRLGRGRGHFDRALSDYSGIKIGVAKETSVHNEIPTEKHDVKIHGLVTPVGVLYFAGGAMWRQ